MLILKSVPLLVVATLAFLPGIAGAANVDVQSGNSRVVIGREGQVYIRNERVGRDVYSDYDDDDYDIDRVIPLPRPYSNKIYRRGYYRDRYYGGSRYYRGKCRGHTYSYSRSGSSTYSSTTVCR
ncbi:MAG: hypothetical protein HC852_10700 [Acaryochloridaceae cyanobacterium RU_4_10]|nr:hypothetical protein [Acaryochloridaceae cyanobacterium RU_4_10]